MPRGLEFNKYMQLKCEPREINLFFLSNPKTEYIFDTTARAGRSPFIDSLHEVKK